MYDFHKIKKILIAFFALLIFGTLGYTLILRISLLKAFYMTVITISTVGFKEVATLTPSAIVFTIILIFLGLGIVGYTLTSLAMVFVEGHLQKVWRGRLMENRIKRMEDHYIICGHEAIAEEIRKELEREGKPYVFLVDEIEIVQRFLVEKITAYHGSSTREKDLLAVGIQQAKGLVTALTDDVDNIVTVLTARDLNPDIHIVSLANEPQSAEKLQRVGANAVLSTSQISGRRMAALLTKPHVISFLDVLTKMGGIEYDLEQVTIGAKSELVSKSLAEAQIPSKTGLVVFAIKKAGHQLELNPSGSLILHAGDVLLILGREEKIKKLRRLAQDSNGL